MDASVYVLAHNLCDIKIDHYQEVINFDKNRQNMDLLRFEPMNFPFKTSITYLKSKENNKKFSVSQIYLGT